MVPFASKRENHLVVAGSILTACEEQYRNTQLLYPVRVNGFRTSEPRGLNKGRGSKFHVGSQVRQTSEEGRRPYRPKLYEYKNKDEDNSPKILNDKDNFLLFDQWTFVVRGLSTLLINMGLIYLFARFHR